MSNVTLKNNSVLLPLMETLSDRQFLIGASHLFGLIGLAIAQPLYDLLGQYSTFFVAHNASAGTIWLFVLALSFGFPLLLALLEAVFFTYHKSAYRYLHSFFIFIGITLLALQILGRLTGNFGVILIFISLLISGGLVALYWRVENFRSFLTIVSVAGLIIPISFLALSPVSELAFAKSTAATITENSKDQPPVVFVLLDELPTQSLLTKEGEFNRTWFPNLAKLLDESTWFSNALAVHNATFRAVPAILSSTLPKKAPGVATTKAYPDNLFTWLGDSYQMNVVETVTALCPDNLCEGGEFDFRLFLSDLKIVFLHVIYPDDLAQKYLPPLGSNWNNFALKDASSLTFVDLAKQNSDTDRISLFRQFVSRIKSGNTLNFLHLLAPHTPYQFMPSGLQYTNSSNQVVKGIRDKVWIKEQRVVEEGYHRYLLQLGLVDTLIGELIDHLKTQNIYDDALIVIAADHGMSFRAGTHKRKPDDNSASYILRAPLIVKAPGQKNRQVNDKVISGLDVVPLISDILGKPLTWNVQGNSPLQQNFKDRPFIKIGKKSFATSAVLKDPYPDWHYDKFDLTRPLSEVVLKGPYDKALMDANLSSLNIDPENQIDIISKSLSDFLTPTEAKKDFPYFLDGHLRSKDAGKEPVSLAVAVDDKIVTTTQSFAFRGKPHFFTCLIPEGKVPGDVQRIAIYAIQEGPEGLSLIPTKAKPE